MKRNRFLVNLCGLRFENDEVQEWGATVKQEVYPDRGWAWDT